MTTTKPKTAEKRPVPGSRIEVQWADCFTVDAWMSVDDLLTKTLSPIVSTGYFVGVTADECWALASGMSIQDSVIHGGSTWFIPVSMIRSWVSTES